MYNNHLISTASVGAEAILTVMPVLLTQLQAVVVITIAKIGDGGYPTKAYGASID
ncbi:MAG: hypothetical protein Q8Q81_16770 [Oxalobacteraceae bacterium]|nr:hypothetical protein [Oxalobacteraceae bacterium]